jgi:hypothetical protein
MENKSDSFRNGGSEKKTVLLEDGGFLGNFVILCLYDVVSA